MTRHHYPEDPEIIAERENVFRYVLGAVWVSYLCGVIGLRDAERLDRALKRAAHLPRPLPEWAIPASDTRH
jgi:hypothetical protein